MVYDHEFVKKRRVEGHRVVAAGTFGLSNQNHEVSHLRWCWRYDTIVAMKNAKIMLLEDDIDLSATLCEYLEDSGYEVEALYDFESAQTRLFETRYDLLLLDVNIPGGDGFSLLRGARGDALQTPAIFMTTRGAMEDLERGYESGGDDYLRKPFALKELRLRVESMLRRNYFHAPSELMLLGDDIRYDTEQNALHVKGDVVTLSDKEARLLKLLVQQRGRVLSHEVIMEHLYDFEETPSDSALRTYIKNLRKILGKDAIVSYKRLGYQLR